MVILSVDYGDRRTGVAVCDKLQMLASPVGVITGDYEPKIIDAVIEYATQYKAEKIVVGLPKNMDGTEGFRAEATYEFAENLKTIYSGEIIFRDERLTTVGASRFLNETNTKGKARKNVIDTVSACLILEGYLNESKNS